MSITFTPFTHDAMVAGIHAIAEAAADWGPSLLVGVGRGGLTPAVFLSHRMGVPLVSIDHSTRIAQFGEELVAVLAQRTRDGDRLLFVEDINDSGRTIGEIRTALQAEGAVAANIRFAVLLDNIRSAQRIDYAARTIDRSVDKDWFVFPWEAMAPRATIEEDAMEVPDRIA
ncbi:phosphoribosyltransferase [Sphingomonas hengshuiensis]|uniref:Phosphoribosyltransferase n=1 Tax=Sphingomonas hengshuiensis TaxID=1609977 RepID=A0A7U4J7W5_9SPHN|nr:phosphoribosyltransferase family protein [Sphingomonas hengshuiensis]AJP71843.1 phosphoribosyltransferase [Sphingomonas hengshuiensis]